jgi:tRNA uracil 4-sulfurtransferase
MPQVILCRYGELFLKLGNRTRFEQMLVANARAAVADLPGTVVENPHGRLLARPAPESLDEACDRLERVFGLVSLSPAEELPADMEALEQAALRVAAAAIERDPRRRRSFRIEARRSDKRFPATSQQIAARLGSVVAAATGIPVDLHDPALVVGVEVGAHQAYVFADTRAAPGGLPVGSAGKALLLLSGGIDSPVAGWLGAKRGLALEALYFHSPPFVGEKSRDKVVSLARALGRWRALRALHVVTFTETQKRLRDAGPAELAVVLYRRMMMRVADVVADRLGAQALLTGENLGQVASQTLTNLGVIDSAARRLVLRPLVTYDKHETVALARRIGSYDLSVLPYEDCCSLFVPPHPATGARLADVERAEARLDVAAEAQAVAASLETLYSAPHEPRREA